LTSTPQEAPGVGASPCSSFRDGYRPLVTWWALLFGLSILARYEPETWGRAIDINTSPEAVEHLLDSALDSLPELLYRTLTGEV